MDVFILNQQNSIANQFLLELRDHAIQQDRLRFRKNMERLGEIMAYEVSKRMAYRSVQVQTPLANTTIPVLSSSPVIITVLRAGLTYFQGFINYFDRADCGFIGAYRKEGENEITINLEYLATGDLTNREVMIVDPMLATGNSFVRSINALMSHGRPSHLHLISLVAAPEGVDHLKKSISLPTTVYTVAMDEKLNEQFYIVPGLGDAGDLSFGEKI